MFAKHFSGPILVALGQEVPALVLHDRAEQARRVPSPDGQGMNSRRDELEPAGVGRDRASRRDRLAVELGNPAWGIKISGLDVEEIRARSCFGANIFLGSSAVASRFGKISVLGVEASG